MPAGYRGAGKVLQLFSGSAVKTGKKSREEQEENGKERSGEEDAENAGIQEAVRG